MLRLVGLDVAVGSGKRALPIIKGVSLCVYNRSIVALLGESGVGKTTLVRALIALLPAAFAVRWDSFSFAGRKFRDSTELSSLRGRAIFYAPQNASASLNPCQRIRRQIAECAILAAEPLRLVLQGLEIDSTRIMEAYPCELSGGEAQRCLLALGLALQPQLLILDEPGAGLDASSKQHMRRLLKAVPHLFGPSLLLITHELDLARQLADQVCLLHDGELVEQGDIDAVFSSPGHAYTRAIVSDFWEWEHGSS